MRHNQGTWLTQPSSRVRTLSLSWYFARLSFLRSSTSPTVVGILGSADWNRACTHRTARAEASSCSLRDAASALWLLASVCARSLIALLGCIEAAACVLAPQRSKSNAKAHPGNRCATKTVVTPLATAADALAASWDAKRWTRPFQQDSVAMSGLRLASASTLVEVAAFEAITAP